MAYANFGNLTPPAYDAGPSAGPEPIPLQDEKFADGSPSPSSPAYQPGVIYVVQNANSGHVVLPTVTSSTPTADSRQVNAEDGKETFTPHIILSCFVFWLCGILFGLVALILALLARRKLSAAGTPEDVKKAHHLGKASYVASFAGVVVAFIIVFVILIVIVSRNESSRPTKCKGFIHDGSCYIYRSTVYGEEQCAELNGHYNLADKSCFYDGPADDDDDFCRYFVNLKCYQYADSSYTESACDNIGGTYTNQTCYYVSPDCQLYRTSNGQCYTNRSDVLTCSTCQNIGGRYENGYCYYFRNNCSAYSIDGQCYSSRFWTFSSNKCNDIDGQYRDNFCYSDTGKCGRNSHYKNCTCFANFSAEKTAGTCSNIGGYYDVRIRRCFYNASDCPYYDRNDGQCYRYRNANFSRITCSTIKGYYSNETDEIDGGRQRYVCYFNRANCSNWFDEQCYAFSSSTYNEGTCASVGGYYSQDICYYNSLACNYLRGGQCYDRYHYGWYRSQCEAARGYYSNFVCFTSDYYCPLVVAAQRKCYSYSSAPSECSSCRLRGGSLHSGTCYYNVTGCPEPLYLAGNGLCYENRTDVGTAAECRLFMPGITFYDDEGGVGFCYFSVGSCTGSGQHYVNCKCYSHRSTSVYSADSCRNFGGFPVNETCYYNSSHCPDSYHSINGQCYRRANTWYSSTTCRNIGGHYESGTCYYNAFDCSRGFVLDGLQCFMNRLTTSSRQTCRNIGGTYGYVYTGRDYISAGSQIYPYKTYHCLYNTFNCSGYAINDECHLYQTSTASADTCRNLDGTFVEANQSCYYNEHVCPYYNFGGQCYSNVSCDAFSCETCQLYGGYHEPKTRCCYYTSRVCKYFVDGECYERHTTAAGTSSTCETDFGGYFSKGRCYYRVPRSCSADHYLRNCTCYPHRSSAYSNGTCVNIGGFYTDDYCYFMQFNCVGYAVNDQCYTRSETRLTRGTCDNIGGFYASNTSYNSTSSQTTSIIASSLPAILTTEGVDRCYYHTFDCSAGYVYQGQCYTNVSRSLGCETCDNIGGLMSVNDGCYYYSSDCPYYPVPGQCHTNRWRAADNSSSCDDSGYLHTDGYCYNTPANCSSPNHLYNCHCYSATSASYTGASCLNVRGTYANRTCYYDSVSYCRHWYNGQCYNRRQAVTRATCRRQAGVYNYPHCYYNSF